MQDALEKRFEQNGSFGGGEGAVNWSKRRYFQVFSDYNQRINTWFY